MKKNRYKSTSGAYLGTLRDVLENYDYTPEPRGQKTREKLDYTFEVLYPRTNPIVTKDEERNKIIAEYSQKEFDLYNSMSNDVNDFAKASKFWKNLANPDRTVNSAYGFLIWKNRSHGHPDFETREQYNAITQEQIDGITDYPEAFYRKQLLLKSAMRTPWEWARMSLIEDADTRQAILRFSLPEHQWKGNKDQTCTMHGIFNIRNNRLNFSVVMRSNDLMKGLVYDLPWFVSLMYQMVDELKASYPELTVGKYTHTVHSMHIYERDIPAIKKMLGMK